MSDAVSPHIAERLNAAAAACAANGTQLTALRREVLALILQAGTPLTAYQLLDLLKQTRTAAVPPTVYRALDFLIANRLVHKLERLNAFIPCAEADHTHHSHVVQFLICGQCGTVAEIEDAGVAAALSQAAAGAGFSPRHAMVELEGLCAACQTLGRCR